MPYNYIHWPQQQQQQQHHQRIGEQNKITNLDNHQSLCSGLYVFWLSDLKLNWCLTFHNLHTICIYYKKRGATQKPHSSEAASAHRSFVKSFTSTIQINTAFIESTTETKKRRSSSRKIEYLILRLWINWKVWHRKKESLRIEVECMNVAAVVQFSMTQTDK